MLGNLINSHVSSLAVFATLRSHSRFGVMTVALEVTANIDLFGASQIRDTTICRLCLCRNHPFMSDITG